MRIQTAPLTKQEFIGLMRMAQREARTPNEQLRYLLRQALGFVETEQERKRNNAGAIGDQTHTGIVTVTR